MSPRSARTAVLLIGFGGPTAPEEVKPFLDSVLEGVSMPPERVREVERHYKLIGGYSPFNEISHRQKEALERYFRAKNVPFPVQVAFRHSSPDFKEAFDSLKQSGVEKAVGFLLTSFRSFASDGKYRLKVAEGRIAAEAEGIELCYTRPFFRDPAFIEAQAERVREIWDSWSPPKKAATFVLYTAHSIPVKMCEESCQENAAQCYGTQFQEAASEVSRRLHLAGNWAIGYQSRSGAPREPWLGPDVKELIERLDAGTFRDLLIIPIGFLCDNVEILYDLDVEAKDLCQSRGLRYHRASPVNDHPRFIEMIGSQVLERA